MRGSLVIGHDGFYMPYLANNAVACAAVFYCSHTNQYADVIWVEKSTKKAANNYCAEILGTCSTQLIIKAAITGHNVLGHGPLTMRCNNMGVVHHGNSNAGETTIIRCFTVLQRPYGFVQNWRMDATRVRSCR